MDILLILSFFWVINKGIIYELEDIIKDKDKKIKELEMRIKRRG